MQLHIFTKIQHCRHSSVNILSTQNVIAGPYFYTKYHMYIVEIQIMANK